MDKINTLHALKVGDIVCARRLGSHTANKEWKDLLELLEDATVVKVGTKYITVKIGAREYQFEMENGCQKSSGYSDDYRLFPSRLIAEERLKKVYLYFRTKELMSRMNHGMYTAENSAQNLPLSSWEAIASLLKLDIPWRSKIALVGFPHQKGDICLYSYDKDPNKSKAIVEIVRILGDPRGAAEIRFHSVICDDTGNGLFDYLQRSGKTMNASLKYLKILHSNHTDPV